MPISFLRNMIIAFDGNVFSGKTSLIKELASLGDFNIVEEHSCFLEDVQLSHSVNTPEIAILTQSKYLDAEVKRSLRVKHEKINLVDRSFVSMAAHIFALHVIFGIDIREWFWTEIEKLMFSEKIIIPDKFCFVRCGHKTIKRRHLKELSRGTGSVYYSEKYLEIIDKFNQAWSLDMSGIIINAEDMSPNKLAEELLQQINISNTAEKDKKSINNCLRALLFTQNNCSLNSL